MAELDYAYLCDYVTVQDGKLTAVGASFTFVRTSMIPGAMDIGIGGRVRASIDEGPVGVEFKITAPGGSFEITHSGSLEAGPLARPYADGVVGLLFALNTQIVFEMPGLYEVRVLINGKLARRLAFELEMDK